MLDIHSLMKSLAERRSIFHLEADFQFALAWRIKELIQDREVRLEFKPFANEGMYLDIWLPTIGTAIELKYFTQRLDIEVNGEQFALKDQSAQPLSRYDFVKDIGRLERVVTENEAYKNGFAILLTNDASYWKPPAPRWQITMDAHFRLHEGRAINGDLEWKDGTNPKTIKNRESPILLSNSYDLHWQAYSQLDAERNGRFRYLAVAVGS